MARSTTPIRLPLFFAAALSVAACSGGPSNPDAGAVTDGGHDAGTVSATDAGNGGGDGGSVTYCDGIQVTTGSGAAIDLLLYPTSQDVAASCAILVNDAGTFAASGTLTQAGGIWDSYAFASTEPLNGLYPGGCDDVGAGSGPAGGTFSPPDAGMTVAAAVAAAKAAGTDGGVSTSLYGVVTFVASGWGGSNGGNFYLQDAVASGSSPQPGSGVDIYVGASVKNVPAAPPNRGDVVLVSGVTWSPYKGINEFAYQDGSTMVLLGQSALPPPVAATAAQLDPTSTALDGYKGMRVADVESVTISPTCPPALQYTASGGG